MNKLSHDERLRLLKFVCSFAWTDLSISDSERDIVERMAGHPDFNEIDRAKIAEWLKVPPPPEETDPTRIPLEHRQLFLDAMHAIVVADGRISDSERESIALFEELVRTAN